MSEPNEQKDAPAKEELNPPCPQCGGKVKQKPHNLGHECTDCEMDLYDDYRLWWCYREIDRLKAAIQAKDAKIDQLHKENIKDAIEFSRQLIQVIKNKNADIEKLRQRNSYQPRG